MKKYLNISASILITTFLFAEPVSAHIIPSDFVDMSSTSSDLAGGILGDYLKYVVDTIVAVSGSWFIFQLYKAIMVFTHSASQAQKREEAKSCLIYVGISGVLLGGAVAISSALYNFGVYITK